MTVGDDTSVSYAVTHGHQAKARYVPEEIGPLVTPATKSANTHHVRTSKSEHESEQLSFVARGALTRVDGDLAGSCVGLQHCA